MCYKNNKNNKNNNKGKLMGFEKKNIKSKKIRYKINGIVDSGLSHDTLMDSLDAINILQDTTLNIKDVLNFINEGSSDQSGEYVLPTIDDLKSCKKILETCETKERDNKTPSMSTSKARREANLNGLAETIRHIDERIKVREVYDRGSKDVREPQSYLDKFNTREFDPTDPVAQWDDYKQKIKAFNADLQAILKGEDFKNKNFLKLNEYINSLFKTEPEKSAELIVFEQMIAAFKDEKSITKSKNVVAKNIQYMCQTYEQCEANEGTLGNSFRMYEDHITSFEFRNLLDQFKENNTNQEVANEIASMCIKHPIMCRATETTLGEDFKAYQALMSPEEQVEVISIPNPKRLKQKMRAQR